MKRLLFFLPLLLLFPATAEASYSYRTQEFVDLRNLTETLRETEDVETTNAERATLAQNLLQTKNKATASIDKVRDTEKARLDAAYRSRVAKINALKAQRIARAEKAINKWCARKKRGKTAQQQAGIQKKCDAKIARATATHNKWATREIAEVEKAFGASSKAQVRLQEGHGKFAEYISEYYADGEDAIKARPYPAPANTVLPVISGSALQGQPLSATNGSWSSEIPLTYSYQWQRCGEDANSCTNIAGANSATYTVVAGDATKKLRVVVRATNSEGRFTSAASLLTAAVPS